MASKDTAELVMDAARPTATGSVFGWEDDPGASVPPAMPPEPRPVPDLAATPFSLEIRTPRTPPPGQYPLGSREFRYWSAAEAAARGASFWRPFLPEGVTWQPGEPLPLLLDEGVDLNAFYDRQALNFFHETVAGRTVYSGESPDIVCHEEGHAVLDALRPELWDAGSIEAAAFHEAFGDISAILSALQLQSLRRSVIGETGGNLTRSSRLSRLAEQLGWAIRQLHPQDVDPDCLRNAVNSFFYHDPETLPPSAPANQLASEPHSFSRVFTAAFFEALANGFRSISTTANEVDLLAVANDFGRLLVAAVFSAPIVPEYFAQIAAALVDADARAQGANRSKYHDVLVSAFVRCGILSTPTIASMPQFSAAAPVQLGIAPAEAAPRELPVLAISGSAYGLGEVPLLVRAAAEPRHFAATAGAFGVGVTSPSSSERAARSFVDDLMQRGCIDIGEHGDPRARIVHPHTFKTHRLVKSERGLELRRILFDCGFCAK